MDAAKVVKSNSEDFRLKPSSLGWIKAKQLDPKTFSSRRLTRKTSSVRGYDDYFLSTRKSDHDYEYDDHDYNYHGVSIPFRWESQPGTPKHNFHVHTTHEPLPPLTPPPSFFYTPTTPTSTPRTNINSKYKRRFLKPNYDLLRKIFHSPKRPHSHPPSPSSPASSSSSSSSSSTFSAPRFSFESATSRRMANIRECHHERTMYGRGFDDRDDDYEVSSLCFGKSPASYFAMFKSATTSIPNKKKTFNY